MSIVAPDFKSSNDFRFSGHETFGCKFAWIPKASRAITESSTLLNDDEEAMVQLGLGKNMVKSLRFWVVAMGVAENKGAEGYSLTNFGKEVFGPTGLDRYIELPATSWLLHWNLATRRERPLFAWHFIFNCWPYPEFTRSELLAGMKQAARSIDGQRSDVTLSQHLDAFFHTYQPSRGQGREDALDSPLAHLDLLSVAGSRVIEQGKSEVVFALKQLSKRTFSRALLTYSICDYWESWHGGEGTLNLYQLAHGDNSPGRVLRLSEYALREVCEEIAGGFDAPFRVGSSSIQYTLTRENWTRAELLARVYA